MSTFGKRTVLLRKSLGMTQKEFAKAADFSQSNLSLLENDGVIPNLGFVINVSEAFPQINLNWWILGRESMFVEKKANLDDLTISPDLKSFLKELNESVENLKHVNFLNKNWKK
jgi:transcriptional regulator with XRE-family HTH domain